MTQLYYKLEEVTTATNTAGRKITFCTIAIFDENRSLTDTEIQKALPRDKPGGRPGLWDELFEQGTVFGGTLFEFEGTPSQLHALMRKHKIPQLYGKCLRESLKDWTEVDFALRAVSTSLGILPPMSGSWDDTKGLFWSRHSLNVWAHKVLRDLCDVGVLEYREEPEEAFRWKGHFPAGGDEKAFGPS